jgi:hypothetical protein
VRAGRKPFARSLTEIISFPENPQGPPWPGWPRIIRGSTQVQCFRAIPLAGRPGWLAWLQVTLDQLHDPPASTGRWTILQFKLDILCSGTCSTLSRMPPRNPNQPRHPWDDEQRRPHRLLRPLCLANKLLNLAALPKLVSRLYRMLLRDRWKLGSAVSGERR